MRRLMIMAAGLVATLAAVAGVASPTGQAWTCEPDDYLESECGPTTVAATTTVVVTTPQTVATTTTEVTTSTTGVTTTASIPTTTTVETSAPSTTTTTTPESTSTSTSPSTSTTSSTTPSTTTPETTSTTSTTPSTTSSSTSTTSTSTTTTTLPELLSIAALAPECINDVPYILAQTGNQPQLEGMPMVVEFFALDGALVQVNAVTYHVNTTYHFLYPGAAVDANGNATDWPGWVQLPDGRWTEDPTDSFLRDGLHVTADVNPHAEGDVSYPPATSACASPLQTPPRLVPGELPPTE